MDSTNRVALELAAAGEGEGTIVITDYQTAGRGRRDRSWWSPRGRNLLFSLIVRPKIDVRSALPLTLAFSCAIAEVLSPRLGHDLGVSWPNDVISSQGKLVGILADAVTRGKRLVVAAVGIGINVNVAEVDFPPGLNRPACSCLSLTGREHDRAPLLAEVLRALEATYDVFSQSGFAGLRDRYRACLRMVGRRVTVARGGRGEAATVVDVATDGGLVVAFTGGRRETLYDEEVSVKGA